MNNDMSKDQPEILQVATPTNSPQTKCKSLETDSHTPESPIQRIPLDVLQRIIVDSLPVHPTIQSATPVISTLTRVSSTWRAAVLLSPRLWSTLFVTVYVDDDLNKCAKVVTQWFQRARSAPLSFFLNIRFSAQHDDIARIRTFLIDLSSIMPKVYHFGFHARLTESLLCSFADLEWKLPRLKKLDLFSHANFDKRNPVAFSSPVFHNAPNLVQVAIQNSITSACDIQHVLPWSQLTRISVAYCISISRWIEIMNMCPMMRQCDIVLGRSDEATSSSPNSYLPNGTSHNLKHLDFAVKGGVPFLEPLSLYNLPSLKNLYVLYNSEPTPGPIPTPQGISALTNLREFSFNRGSAKIYHEYITYLVEVLREMVNLETLLLQQTTKDFIPLYNAISFKSPGEPILPQLRSFQLWITTDCEVLPPEQDEELDPLVEMASSRSSENNTIPVGCKPLQEFYVGVENSDVYERTKKRFGFWVALPPQFRFEISVSREFRFGQPEGWTYPISD